MNRLNRVVVGFSLIGLLLVGCDSTPGKKDTDNGHDKEMTSMKSDAKTSASNLQADAVKARSAVALIKPSQAATTQPVNSNVMGTVTFMQAGESVKVIVDLTGFAPVSEHGFHIHDKGDLTDPNLTSAGPHFNPAGHKHGGPDSPMAHAGDLGNITADANGNVKTEMTLTGISLDPAALNCVIGRSVIVHAKADDLKTDPAGNAGSRIAGGKIEEKL